MATLQRSSFIPDDANDKLRVSFGEASDEFASSDWSFAKEVINYFPYTFFTILEGVFPLIASSVKSAGVVPRILNVEIVFDLRQRNTAPQNLQKVYKVIEEQAHKRGIGR